MKRMWLWIFLRFKECGEFARKHNLRLSFHPDQVVVLNSPSPKTPAHSLAELNYQAEVAEWVGADTVNIHGGRACHHNYINAADFPKEWLGWPLTVEVEAKAKELAVARLIADLHEEGGSHAR